MAGWTNSTGAGTSGGRGSGGTGFTTDRYTNNSFDMIHGATGGSGWFRGASRSRGRPPPPPQYRYRRVDAVHRDYPPASLSEQQAASSTSRRHAQRSHPISTAGKSSASGTAAPPSTMVADDKASRSAANFECNVCFDMAAEPVVTKCGHLFCWECLYQWLHVHSHHRECPVCKGQVADDAIIPIYGRGGSAASVNNAPPRPTGARVESSRQQQLLPYDSLYSTGIDFEAIFRSPTERLLELASSIVNRVATTAAIDREATSSTDLDEALYSVPPNFDDLEMDLYDDTMSFESDIEEVYERDYHLMGVPVIASAGTEAGNPSSSQARAGMINIRYNIVGAATGFYRQQEFGYSASNPHNNRGRRGRRNRARVSTDHSSADGMVMGGSGALYRGNGGSYNNFNAGGFVQHTNGSWTERRGRSNRNSNPGGGRGGMEDRRRPRTNYNW